MCCWSTISNSSPAKSAHRKSFFIPSTRSTSTRNRSSSPRPPSRSKPTQSNNATAFPRQVAMYIVKQLTTASLPEIGRQFGGKHHPTVLHSINKIEELRRTDKDLNRTITRLLDALQ